MIREACPADYDALGDVMFQAIRTGPSPYTDAQRRAWIAAPHGGAGWQAKLAAQFVVVAEAGERLTGFMTLRPDGCIDLAFILPEARGTGLFQRLYAQLENQAKTLALGRAWTHASLTAQPAFAAVGFHVVRHELVTLAGQELARAEMEKRL